MPSSHPSSELLSQMSIDHPNEDISKKRDKTIQSSIDYMIGDTTDEKTRDDITDIDKQHNELQQELFEGTD